jgi:hypothetical protein
VVVVTTTTLSAVAAAVVARLAGRLRTAGRRMAGLGFHSSTLVTLVWTPALGSAMVFERSQPEGNREGSGTAECMRT